MLILCWLNLHFTVSHHFPKFSWQHRGSIAPQEPKAISAWAVFFFLPLYKLSCSRWKQIQGVFTLWWDFVISQFVLYEPNPLSVVTTGRSDFTGRKRFLHPCCQVSSELGLWSSQHQGSFPNSWNQSHAIFPQAHVWKAQTYFPIEVKVCNHPIYFKDIIKSAL